MRTDIVNLCFLNSKYFQVNLLLRRFFVSQWQSPGLSSRALRTSAHIFAFKWPNHAHSPISMVSSAHLQKPFFRIFFVMLKKKKERQRWAEIKPVMFCQQSPYKSKVCCHFRKFNNVDKDSGSPLESGSLGAGGSRVKVLPRAPWMLRKDAFSSGYYCSW